MHDIIVPFSDLEVFLEAEVGCVINGVRGDKVEKTGRGDLSFLFFIRVSKRGYLCLLTFVSYYVK